jgi:hypothetical protein
MDPVSTAARRTSMPLWGQVLVGLAVLHLITIVCALYVRWKQKQKFAQEAAELFALKEGQTIMAVVDEKNILYFCIGRDG